MKAVDWKKWEIGLDEDLHGMAKPSFKSIWHYNSINPFLFKQTQCYNTSEALYLLDVKNY